MKTFWISLQRLVGMSPDQKKQLMDELQGMEMSLGIDLRDDYRGDREQRDTQLDCDEYIDDMGQGGKRYRERR